MELDRRMSWYAIRQHGMGSQDVFVCDSSTKMIVTKGRFYGLPMPVVAPVAATGIVKL